MTIEVNEPKLLSNQKYMVNTLIAKQSEMLQSVKVTWGAEKRASWKCGAWVPPYKVCEVLYITEFLAGSQISWALQQHGLAAEVKIT